MLKNTTVPKSIFQPEEKSVAISRLYLLDVQVENANMATSWRGGKMNAQLLKGGAMHPVAKGLDKHSRLPSKIFLICLFNEYVHIQLIPFPEAFVDENAREKRRS